MNIRVLQNITSLGIGGAEKLLIDITPLCQQKGIEIDVLSLDNTETLFWEKLKKHTSGTITGITSKSVYNPILVFKIIPYLKKYDIVHAHLFPTLYWVVLAKWISFSKTKIIYTEHSTDNKRRHSYIMRFLDKLIYRGVKQVVTISDEVDVNLKKHLNTYNDKKFKKIYNGVDVELYANANTYLKSDFFTDKDFILIQVSSFREQKDHKTLIKSLVYLPERIKLILVGDGPLRKELESLISELNLTKRVLLLGVRTDVHRLLKTADVVILSSHHEGLSLSSIEGMASGRPFIASNVPGLKDIVADYGLLFEKGDGKALAEHVLSLYRNKDYYQKITIQCMKRAKMFDIENMVDDYIQLYKNL